jgi:hypothetical protein
LAFVRLATNPIVVHQPASQAAAWRQVTDWLDAEAVWVPLPTERRAALSGEFCQASWMTSRLVADAHLAVLAVEHGLPLCSTDGDFAKFQGLTLLNPLAAG